MTAHQSRPALTLFTLAACLTAQDISASHHDDFTASINAITQVLTYDSAKECLQQVPPFPEKPRHAKTNLGHVNCTVDTSTVTVSAITPDQKRFAQLTYGENGVILLSVGKEGWHGLSLHLDKKRYEQKSALQIAVPSMIPAANAIEDYGFKRPVIVGSTP